MSPPCEQHVAVASGGTPGGDGQASTFSKELAELKNEGASLLVVGDVAARVHAFVGRELLGGTDEERRRVLAFSDPGVSPIESWLPTGASRHPDHLQVVVNGHTRSAAADRSQSGDWAPVHDDNLALVSDDGIDTFGIAIADAIDRVASLTSTLDPGELRFGFNSLGPLLERSGVKTVATFTHLLGHEVRTASGRAFFHLPRPFDDETVAKLRPYFDIVIELGHDESPRQRWHVVGGSTSDWFPVDPDAACRDAEN